MNSFFFVHVVALGLRYSKGTRYTSSPFNLIKVEFIYFRWNVLHIFPFYLNTRMWCELLPLPLLLNQPGIGIYSFILVRFYAWNMLLTSKQLLIWFDRSHTCMAPPMLNLFTNKRFRSEKSNQYHVTCLSPNANNKFIYLLHCSTVTKVLTFFLHSNIFFLSIKFKWKKVIIRWNGGTVVCNSTWNSKTTVWI